MEVTHAQCQKMLEDRRIQIAQQLAKLHTQVRELEEEDARLEANLMALAAVGVADASIDLIKTMAGLKDAKPAKTGVNR